MEVMAVAISMLMVVCMMMIRDSISEIVVKSSTVVYCITKLITSVLIQELKELVATLIPPINFGPSMKTEKLLMTQTDSAWMSRNMMELVMLQFIIAKTNKIKCGLLTAPMIIVSSSTKKALRVV